MPIAPFTSFLLDGLRLFAAIGVVLVHLSDARLIVEAASFHYFGECFVGAFFVLSGYVIAATTNPRRSPARRYFSVRLARLWTVALPCLLFASLLEILGHQLDPAHFQEFHRGNTVARYLLAATFLNELWFISAGPPIIAPVWSLAYEFWYYVLFGVAVFVKKPVWRVLGIGLVVAVVGPKILALFPMWLFGVLAWRASSWRATFAHLGPWVIVVSAATLLAMAIAQPDWPAVSGQAPWYFSGAWLSNSCFSLGIAALIWGLDACFHRVHVPTGLGTLIRKGANVSFTLYLLHFPLMVFLAALWPSTARSPWQVAFILGLVFTVAFIFGSYIEPQRQWWAARFEKWMASLGAKCGCLPALALNEAVDKSLASPGDSVPPIVGRNV